MAAPRDPRVVLDQMLEAISDIEQITTGRSFKAAVQALLGEIEKDQP